MLVKNMCACLFAISLALISKPANGIQVEAKKNEDQEITSVNTGKKLIFISGDRPVLAYNYKTVMPPKGIGAVYARSGHIHPIYTPGGKIVTDDFSDDHAHQHGLFYAFVKANVGGELIDFWNQHKKTGDVRCDGYIVDPRSPSRVITKQIHFRRRDSKPVFREKWTIDVSEQKGCFVIDLQVDIENLLDEKVVVEKNHYGSFGMRGSGQWRKAKETEFDFTTSTEKNRKTGNLSREKWVAMHGKIDGKFCGVAVLGHSANFRHPQPARLHPTMPYFSFAPMQLGSFDFEAKKELSSRFRLVTFDGKLDRKKIESFRLD